MIVGVEVLLPVHPNGIGSMLPNLFWNGGGDHQRYVETGLAQTTSYHPHDEMGLHDPVIREVVSFTGPLVRRSFLTHGTKAHPPSQLVCRNARKGNFIEGADQER
mmetsp:Transcript_15991/g.32114  ORF Transcript_15991/g.32114 Transcript_15991/m.32114 type:complete len:105 (+) Transcript_15991:3122-3436(+)